MPYEDKMIECVECGQEFVHSGEDQARYAERGFTNEPKRCRECREKRKARGGRGSGPGSGAPSGGRAQRESYEATCAECGTRTTVPFKPTEGRPVYCLDCYRSRRR
ncbi:MAG: zinc-ribbon domain containing protein [Phycisphaerae bacterium]|nr:zinc-ribbon domain containing protein [Phycisphaerae bacterium]